MKSKKKSGEVIIKCDLDLEVSCLIVSKQVSAII